MSRIAYVGRACGISPGPKTKRKGPEKKHYSEEKKHHNSPTAAFLRLVQAIKVTIKKMLNLHATIFAMSPNESPGGPQNTTVEVPTCGMPQAGLTPTGALEASVERPVRIDGSRFCIWEIW